MKRMSQFSAAVLIGTMALTGCTSSNKDQGGSTPSASASDSASTSAADTSANPQIVTLLKKGIDQAQAGQYAAANTTFSNVLTLEPNNKYALYNLGLVAQTQKQNAQAIAYYDKAVASDPTYTPAMYNKAILLEGSNLAGAVALYEKIVQINPKASTAWYRLSLAYAKQGDKAKADDARQKAIALDPSLAKLATASPSPSAKPSR